MSKLKKVSKLNSGSNKDKGSRLQPVIGSKKPIRKSGKEQSATRNKKKTAPTTAGSITAVEDAINSIGGKWKLKIIIALSERNKRFNDLQRTVTGISARVLSNELKDMELNGFIRRKIFTGTPVVVEYELTSYSHTLQDVLTALSNWGAAHRKTIRKRMKKK